MGKLTLRWIAWMGTGALVACTGGDPPRGAGETSPTSGIGLPTETDSDAGSSGAGSESQSGSATDNGCIDDVECPAGEICTEGACVPGCSDDSECDGDSCCEGTCVDLTTDAANCGACGEPCDEDMSCVDGMCQLEECPDGFNDCNGDAGDGCETEGECACTPGDTQSCYTSDPGTEDVGECRAGTETCNEFGTAWGGCEGEIIPDVEICGNGLDDNCDGTADEDPDEDGDGWTVCGGDCCDTPGAVCSNPDLVNPGAFEVDGNMVDDDCDGMVDNPLAACDNGLATNSADPLDFTRAIDLCQYTEETPAAPEDRIWGVIDSSLTLAAGAGVPNANSHALRDNFGSAITTQFGDRLAVLSTGHAADNDDDTNPNYADFQIGVDVGTTSPVPPDWLAANGGNIPNAPGCPDPLNATAHNPVMLTARVRAPTNANSFSVQMYFFSAEYPEYVCTEYNDFFVTLLGSTDVENPADGNIAIYSDGVSTWPVGINLVSTAAGLFTACENGAIAHCGSGGNYNGCAGTGDLAGTGMDSLDIACGHFGLSGGGTGWLTMSGNVEPGEVFDIRFVIWDTSDAVWDSLVLLDNWVWNVDSSEPGVEPS